MTNRLLNVGERFKTEYKLVDGRKFRGQVLDIPDTSRVSNFLSTRRYLRTRPTTFVKPGDVARIDELLYIVAEHGTGFFREPIYKHFKMFEITAIEDWNRAGVETHPISGVDQTVKVPMGKVYLSVQPKSSIEDSIKVQHVTKVALCNLPLQVDDTVGDFIVTKTDDVLGVTLVELKAKS